jgi:N-acetylglucosaminyldiphosphoundecaprenol N-acetyl-beta-D-mannosaminyltransferase
MRFPETQVLGVKVSSIPIDDLETYILWLAKVRSGQLFPYINVHGLNLAQRDERFRSIINSSSAVLCDGYGAGLAAQLNGLQPAHRLTYPDWSTELAQLSARHRLSIYFLGGRRNVAARALARMKVETPEMIAAGSHHGYFDLNAGSDENEAVIREINAARPDILMVGFGMPLQEYWLDDNAARLDAGALMTGGAVFDYIAGTARRGPSWMTDHGFEWLARLIIEPRRLWRRYLLGLPLFGLRFLIDKLRAKP